MSNLPRARYHTVRLQVTFGPEAEPLTEPAIAQEGVAQAVLEDDSEDWELVRARQEPIAPAAPAVPPAAWPAQRSLAFTPTPVLLRPVVRYPFIDELLDSRNRVHIAWSLPGHPTWSEIHYRNGSLAWLQLRSWACAAHPELAPTASFKLIRWQRVFGLNHNQLVTALGHESAGEAVVRFWYWSQ